MIVNWSKSRKVIFTVGALGLLVSVVLLLPFVRTLAIGFMETFIMQRELKSPDRWIDLLRNYAACGIALFASLLAIIAYHEELKNIILSINYKQLIIPFIIMSIIYVLSISSIIQADFLYRDDINRSISGARRWDNYSRYISNFLAILIHTNIRISDISPLTQILAAIFIAASSVMLVYVLNNKKITKTALAASLPLGLSPYFLECFSFKFDSPYMALSVFASIIPFFFMENRRIFSIISVIGIWVMCMTYQASSGIYIIIVIFLCFLQWNTRQKTNKEILAFMFVSAISYCVATLIFALFIMRPFDDYVASSLHSLLGAFRNFTTYIYQIRSDFNIVWKTLLFLVIVAFVIKSVITTKRRKLFAFFVSFIVVITMAVLSYGIYLVMSASLYAPRAMYGFGVFIAILGIYTACPPKKAFVAPALALCWCFFVFAFVYGNALSAQKKYVTFRSEMLLHDLSTLFPQHHSALPMQLQLEGSTGYAPVVHNIAVSNPVIFRLVPIDLHGKWFSGAAWLARHYNFRDLVQSESSSGDSFNQIFDSYYHTIKSDGEQVMVILK